MAQFIEKVDPQDEIGRELEQTQQQKASEAQLPDKYKGKSVADIVRMHQEAESVIGRQGQELGQLRSVSDAFIKRTLDAEKAAEASKSTPKTEDDTEFFTDPKTAVRKIVQEAIQPIQQDSQARDRQVGMAQMLERHPDAHDIAKTEDFQKWVMGSRVRQSLFAQADKFDFDAAEELVSTYKALKGIVPKQEAQTEADPKAKVVAEAKPSTGKTLPKGTVPTELDGDTKKIYRRADIIRLIQTDRKRYDELEPEIRLAYSEKRVR